MMTELKIAEDKEEYYDLETLILEGQNAKQEITVEFPSGKKCKALIKPVVTKEFDGIYNANSEDMVFKILEGHLLYINGNVIPRDLIEVLPIGVPGDIMKKIFKISGISLDNDDAEHLKKNSEFFPRHG